VIGKSSKHALQEVVADVGSSIDIRAYRYLKSAHEAWYEGLDMESALYWIDRSLSVAPDFVEALLLKADLLYDDQNESDALALLDDMLQQMPDCMEGYLAKVSMLMNLDKNRLALLICQEALLQAKRHNLMQTWTVMYLVRHKMTLQMSLKRYWSAKRTLLHAVNYLGEPDLKELGQYLTHQRISYRQKWLNSAFKRTAPVWHKK
jgi:tetratricopeptide (TPR) repeat protein